MCGDKSGGTTMKTQRHRGFSIKPFSVSLCFIFAVAFPAVSKARINVVTLPGRDTVQLTIYNSADLTMVKETRVLTFRKGLNKLEFSWANTLIDPTSVEFRALSHADAVDVLDVSFPPRVTNTLEWRINSEVAGEVTCEIRYFTSGISWSADYVAEADKLEKLMNLAGNVRVTNNSGEDYEEAQVRLVVGTIRLVENIAVLASQRLEYFEKESGKVLAHGRRLLLDEAKSDAVMTTGEGGGAGGPVPVEMVKEGLSEYFLYTVGGRHPVATGWSKRLPSFKANDVKVTSYYKFERERWGDQVIRHYKFKNDKESKLGTEPLPDGGVMVTRRVTDDNLLAFVGRTNVKYIPINEEVEMELGNDLEVMVKPRLMNWVKEDLRFDQHGNVVGWQTRETWEFEVQNSKEIDVVLDIRRNFAGDWDLKTAQKHENVDKTKVKFVMPLRPREKKTFSYELTTRHGINVRR
jgi:hypothetical protein